MEFGLEHLVDPRLRAHAAEPRAFYARRTPGRGPNGPEELQRVRSAAAPPAESNPPPALERVDGVPVRIHRPVGPAAAVVLELHGGGFYLGSAAASDVRNRELADSLGVVVVGVDYRLAPEHPWPAAGDDCETVARWLVGNAEELFGTSNLCLHGFSAGSTLAVTTLLRLRDQGSTPFHGAVLQFGSYDLSGLTPAGRSFADEYFLDAYAGSLADRTHPDFSPVFADLSGLPPVLVVVGIDDVLLQDNLAMAVRLSAAGVDVDLRVYPASPHGFTHHDTSMARAARADIESWTAGRWEPLREAPDVGSHLGRERTAWLTTLRADGSPHVTPVWFLHDAGTWWIGSGERNVKVRNLRADPRVSIALPDGDSPVVVEGRARLHRSAFPEHVRRGFAQRYDGWDITDPDQPGGPRVLIEVPVDRWLVGGPPG